ncbi:hypothetical protein WJX81_001510 [Elliptochloris bilobata]|uniref:SHSP domain-containing protein n=1 Tax=Elliptochloris bilobata TaxID=381761 RepID=A0AAW1SEC1_9CHLO
MNTTAAVNATAFRPNSTLEYQPNNTRVCANAGWRAASLGLLQEQPLAGLFPALGNQSAFAASGLAMHDGLLLTTFADEPALGSINARLVLFDNGNRLVAGAGRAGGRGFRDIAHRPDTGTYLLLQDVPGAARAGAPAGQHRQAVVEVALGGDAYSVVRQCALDFNLSGGDSGLSAIRFHADSQGGKHLLGLCSGNYCASGGDGQQRGNGRLVAASLREAPDGSCTWVPERVIRLPSAAYFAEFTSLAFRGNRTLISSRGDSAVWQGAYSWDAGAFVGDGATFHFPRSAACEPIYCSVEAVGWLDDARVVAASGAADASQPYARSSTDISTRTKKLYLSTFAAFEEAVRGGRVPGIVLAEPPSEGGKAAAGSGTEERARRALSPTASGSEEAAAPKHKRTDAAGERSFLPSAGASAARGTQARPICTPRRSRQGRTSPGSKAPKDTPSGGPSGEQARAWQPPEGTPTEEAGPSQPAGEQDGAWYSGVVTAFSPDKACIQPPETHTVMYDDGDVEEHRLDQERWSLLPSDQEAGIELPAGEPPAAKEGEPPKARRREAEATPAAEGEAAGAGGGMGGQTPTLTLPQDLGSPPAGGGSAGTAPRFSALSPLLDLEGLAATPPGAPKGGEFGPHEAADQGGGQGPLAGGHTDPSNLGLWGPALPRGNPERGGALDEEGGQRSEGAQMATPPQQLQGARAGEAAGPAGGSGGLTPGSALWARSVLASGGAVPVFESHPDAPRGFEVHFICPGAEIGDIKIKCWPNGRVRLNVQPGERAAAGTSWRPREACHEVMLPEPVNPHSAAATLSLHGELMLVVDTSEEGALAAL